jgi:hypothetical protein
MNALKTLEARHDFLLANSPYAANKKSYSYKEIKALEEATDFIKWMLNNASDTMVQTITEKYQQESAANMDAQREERNKAKIVNAKNALLQGMLHVFHENSYDSHKIQIILSESNGTNFIQMEELRCNPETRLWHRMSHIKVSLYKFEKILKKAQAIIKIKEGAAPETVPGAEFLYNFLSKHPLNQEQE